LLHEVEGAKQMAEPFLAEIRLMSFNFPPKGWAYCNGQFLSINQNQGLFALLGTTYGGDGRVNFALPDLRGRVPIHFGQGAESPFVLGQRGGSETVTLNAAQAAHTHAMAASSSVATLSSPVGNYPAASAARNVAYATSADTGLNAASVTAAGGGQAHTNMQPSLTIGFCIALQGIFPS
jgi:microcystin-dependent protein